MPAAQSSAGHSPCAHIVVASPFLPLSAMASLNHHPYLSEVLISLQKHQMALESRAHALSSSDTQNQMWTELPWRNEAQEWAALEAQRRAARDAAVAAEEHRSRQDSLGGVHAGHMLYDEARQAFSKLDGTFAVDGREVDEVDPAWEDDSPEMKQALRMAGEVVIDAPPRRQQTQTQQPQEEDTRKPITGPREPIKQSRACSMFSF